MNLGQSLVGDAPFAGMDGDRADVARRSLALYVAMLVPAASVLSALDIAGILHDNHALLMTVPAAASLATRLFRRDGFSDISLQLGGRRGVISIGLGVGIAVLTGIVVYGTAWVTGLARFAPQPFFLAPEVSNPTAQILLWVGAFTLLGWPSLLVATAGEELG